MAAEKEKTGTNVTGEPAPASAGQANSGSEKTVPLKALQEEREKRQKLHEELEALKKQVQQSAGTENKQNVGMDDLDVSLPDVDDLLDLKPADLKKAMKEYGSNLKTALLREMRMTLDTEKGRSVVDKAIAKFAIFQDEDSVLAQSAINHLAREIREKPEEDVEKLAKETAQTFSRYKAAQSGDGGSAGDESHVPPTAGGVATSHLKTGKREFKSFDEVADEAAKVIESEAGKRQARGK